MFSLKLKPISLCLAVAAVLGISVFLPGDGTAQIAFMEQWVLTEEAALRTIDEDCDPDETCLELCLVNPQTGRIIRQGEFQCFANP